MRPLPGAATLGLDAGGLILSHDNDVRAASVSDKSGFKGITADVAKWQQFSEFFLSPYWEAGPLSVKDRMECFL